MIFLSLEDFYEKVSTCSHLSREEEIAYAQRMQNGDVRARERLIQSYLPMVAAHIRHAKPQLQNLGLVLYCQKALENAVDSFDFLQDSETFAHRLSWHLRQAVTSYIAR